MLLCYCVDCVFFCDLCSSICCLNFVDVLCDGVDFSDAGVAEEFAWKDVELWVPLSVSAAEEDAVAEPRVWEGVCDFAVPCCVCVCVVCVCVFE